MTIKDLKSWIARDLHPSKVQVVFDETEERKIYDEEVGREPVGTQDVMVYRIYLYTSDNRYTIVAREHPKDPKYQFNNYLAGYATTRKSRPGEDWHRGNDLPDGKLTEKTWDKILTAIVRYELKDIAKPRVPMMEINGVGLDPDKCVEEPELNNERTN